MMDLITLMRKFGEIKNLRINSGTFEVFHQLEMSKKLKEIITNNYIFHCPQITYIVIILF